MTLMLEAIVTRKVYREALWPSGTVSVSMKDAEKEEMRQAEVKEIEKVDGGVVVSWRVRRRTNRCW